MTGRKLRSPPVAFGTLQHMNHETWFPRSPASLFDVRCSAWEPLAGQQHHQQGGWEVRPRAGLARVSVASEGGGWSEKTVSEVCEGTGAESSLPLRGCGRAGSRRRAGAAEVDYQLCGGERPGKGH